jgi:hypothetical protein
MAGEWTDELKTQVIEEYKAADPTPETSSEIIAAIAEDHEKTPNGVRMILVKAGEYVKTTKPAAGGNGTTKGTRVNKAEAIAGLSSIIESRGLEVNDEIIGKMTGKAANYFTGLFNQLSD